jgi:glycosyltransferase involved in cell wall biosynthesis
MPHVEAQACGKPVLSVDAMGIKETVVHGETGFLASVSEWIAINEGTVGPECGYPEKMTIRFDVQKVIAVRADVDDLAEYILLLLTNDSLAAKLGTAARAHVCRNFGYMDMARRVVSLIRERVTCLYGEDRSCLSTYKDQQKTLIP